MVREINVSELKRQKLKLLQEKQRRDNLPINKYQPDDQPDRNQLAFHQSTARFRLAFGGNRAGKSVVTSYEVAAWARGSHRFQDIPPGPKEIYVVSAEYRTLYQGIHRHIVPDRGGMRFLDPSWIKSYGPKVPGAAVPLQSYIEVYTTHDSQGNLVTNSNYTKEDRPYSTIWFISGDGGEQARKKLQAAAVNLAVIDEEIEETLFDELRMRLLDSNGRLCVSATLVRSEDWLMDLEDRSLEGDPVVHLSRLSTETSKHISDDAKKEIWAGLSAEERAVRVEGRSRRQFGLVYPKFTRDHTFTLTDELLKSFRTDNDYTLIAAIDPGFRVCAALWCAIQKSTGTLYFYRELYAKESMLSEVCRDIATCEGYTLKENHQASHDVIMYNRVQLDPDAEEVEIRLIDPAGMRNMEDGRLGIAAQMTAYYDTPVAPANNDVHYGIEAARRLLETNPLTNRPHALFSTELKNFFSERRKYRLRGDTSTRNAHATKSEPIRKNNHLMDCFRYICNFALFILGDTTHISNMDKNRKRNNFNHGLTGNYQDQLTNRMKQEANDIRLRHERLIQHPYLGSEY